MKIKISSVPTLKALEVMTANLKGTIEEWQSCSITISSRSWGATDFGLHYPRIGEYDWVHCDSWENLVAQYRKIMAEKGDRNEHP